MSISLLKEIFNKANLNFIQRISFIAYVPGRLQIYINTLNSSMAEFIGQQFIDFLQRPGPILIVRILLRQQKFEVT